MSMIRVEALEERRLLSSGVGAADARTAHATLSLPPDVVVGVPVGGELATLEGVDLSRFSPGRLPVAVIRWGASGRTRLQTSPRDVEPPGPFDQVVASVLGPAQGHVFRRPGTYTVRVAFLSRGRALAKATQTVRVADASPTGAKVDAVAGEPFSGQLGTFRATYAEPLDTTIDWGDGTKSAATTELLADGSYRASGSHTYARPGRYHAVVWSGFGFSNPLIMAPYKLPTPVVVAVVSVRRGPVSP